MALYNQLFGENPDAMAILGFAGLSREMFARYRDVFLADNGSTVLVLARTGGGNREAYKDNINSIRKHPNYIEDYDDEDETYAWYRFAVNKIYLPTALKMFKEEPKSVVERMNEHIRISNEDPNSPQHKKDLELAEQLKNIIEGEGKGGFIFI